MARKIVHFESAHISNNCQTLFCNLPAFIHSFKLFVWHLFKSTSLLYSEALPTAARIVCQSFTSKRHRQLQVKDLPKVLRGC